MNEEIRALSYVKGQIVQVARATKQKDHGRDCWLCEALPPYPRYFEIVSTLDEVISWMNREVKAEELFIGKSLLT